MKICQKCGQMVAEEILSCPSCGNEVVEGRKYIDDYQIVEVLHEGYSSILCRAIKEGTDDPVMIRIFTLQSGVDEEIAERLQEELEELKKLPENYFVRHLEIRKSSDGLWYRVSEWIETETWGNLLASGRLQDFRTACKLFYKIASILEGLHQIGHFIPHLILNDLIIIKNDKKDLEVKIDYKVSRFLDPQMGQSPPMLKKLIASHPDIIHQRPLDFRSGIWSLGKALVEILSADYEIKDFHAKIDELQLPQDAKVLLKIMLADDPDLRPQSMSEVADNLSQLIDSKAEAIPSPVVEIRGLKKRVSLLVLILSMLLVVGILAWLYFPFKNRNSEEILEDFANRYASSVAFVLADYWLEDGKNYFYRNRTEGTAFLVDKEGYLLTNRHVACPWLEDNNLYILINRLKQLQRPVRLGYRLFLWFEGEKAFKRLPNLPGSPDLEDIYFVESAYSTDGISRLTIAGVAKPPVKTWQLIKSPLKDDFAVLKVDRLPDGLVPLPIDYEMEALKIQKLSPVITLGFPLGSRTQANTVNVSVTRGHVRRTFENLIQVDTSIHRGNSGGPIIDTSGKVIGIASKVAADYTAGPRPVITLLSDIGMVLPITKAAAFLNELKSGQTKWNGVLDLSVDIKIKQIADLARKGKWDQARALADKDLKVSFDPMLVMAAGMMHLCSEDYQGAKHLFSQALSMDSENNQARWMLFLIDWMENRSTVSLYRQELIALDWRSPFEFYGYLVQVLERLIDEASAVRGGYSEDEKSWLYYILSLVRLNQGNLEDSETLLRKAVLVANNDSWPYLLSISRLEQVQKQRLASLKRKTKRTGYLSDTKKFSQTIKKDYLLKKERLEKLAPLVSRLKANSITPGDKREILEKIMEIVKVNDAILVGMAYYSAMSEEWELALKYARAFLEVGGRENAGRLSVGLLEPCILNHMGRKDEAMKRLKVLSVQTNNHWYRHIAKCLLGEETEQSIVKRTGESPEYMLTAHCALGFWAEGIGENKKALKHYKEALGSYMDDWLEYEFTVERIKKLK
ncbi:MAG: trypsin-like peptidase domain-containing protein [Thermodesulfobacteriota bacterium]|nr:trypsin-like peptidase domain-containing protein [Thermodesulfobacteriota bacterium]